MTAYWPFWIGAPALALVTVGACLVGRRPLGVSGILARFVSFRTEREAERRRDALATADESALEAALLAATLEAFGPSLASADGGSPAPPGLLAFSASETAAPAGHALPLAPAPPATAACGGKCGEPAARPTLGAHAVFLVSIAIGAFLVQLFRGGWRPTFALDGTFERVVASGPAGLAALVLGGLLVGAGTTISGGCSTGHGLSGCSRLQPSGVAATATFFAVAAGVSLLLAGRLS